MSTPTTLVVPARDAEATLGACLHAVLPLLESGLLEEIVVVDDGSSDRTAEIAHAFGVKVVRGRGRGPGAARNLGWREATTPLVWFIDADCVPEREALPILRGHLDDPKFAAAGGSYANLHPDSWLASLIHEEIVWRHATMPPEVDFLATFNVLYRRDVLEAAGGFDESFRTAEDAELAYRVLRAGFRLRFDARSRVGHFHETRLLAYLRTQAVHGFFRVRLYLSHPVRSRGDAYSGPLDHLQPPAALMLVLCVPFVWIRSVALGMAFGAALLALAQVPLTLRLVGRTRRLRCLAFLPLGFARSFARALGAAVAVAHALSPRGRTP